MSFTKRTLVQVVWFYVGMAVMAFGYGMVIRPGVGVSPWDILHLGIQGRTGFPLSMIMQGTGVVIIFLNWALGTPPTVGMVMNMLSYGPMLQWILPWIPQPQTLPLRILMLLTGILVAGLGTALYVSASLGSGPRDGMMIGISRKLGLPTGVVKNGIDITVTLSGWALGGPLGLGTVVVALGMGPSMQFGMSAVRRLAEYKPFSGFVHPVQLKKA